MLEGKKQEEEVVKEEEQQPAQTSNNNTTARARALYEYVWCDLHYPEEYPFAVYAN